MPACVCRSKSSSSEDASWRRASESTPFYEGASMRKSNRYLPPALKHNSRLNNSVVSRRKPKRPNAQKAGVFAEPLILPGEDRREFEALHSAWIEEWTPSGPSEESCVFGCADAEWRKLRSRRFAQAKAIANSLTPAHPAFDETRGLFTFGYRICREPETAFAEYASKLLRADTIRYLNQKFPRQNFEVHSRVGRSYCRRSQIGFTAGHAGLCQARNG